METIKVRGALRPKKTYSRLEVYMLEYGLEWQRACQRAGFHDRTLRAFRYGQRQKLGRANREKLCRVLGIPMSILEDETRYVLEHRPLTEADEKADPFHIG